MIPEYDQECDCDVCKEDREQRKLARIKKYNLPLTYKPKIPKVLNGECRQTIRIGRKFQVGDLISFHGWEGTPYRSKWSFRTPYFEVESVEPIIIYRWGIYWPWAKWLREWTFDGLDVLAELDGIDPPTGIELGRVLTSYHKVPDDGAEAQIIRWRWTE